MFDAYIKMMKNYANFKGRTNRADFWKAILVYWLGSMILGFVVGFIGGFLDGFISAATTGEATMGIFTIIAYIITSIFSLVHLVPVLAIEVRRLHDINKSGWFLLLGLLSVCCGIGAIILIVFYCFDSVEEGKQYGDYV